MKDIGNKVSLINCEESSMLGISSEGKLYQKYPLKILVAEDNLINRKLVTCLLSQMGFTVDSVINGLEAYEMVKQMDFDIVLMDIQMPEMTGIEATIKIKNDLPANRQPLIIALTANVMAEDRDNCISCGMVDYMPKPVNFHLLQEMLIKWGNYLSIHKKQ